MATKKHPTPALPPRPLTALAEALSTVSSAEEMEHFLQELLTDSELRDITLRWQLLNLLTQGVPQRKIADTLQISLCKITRGSRILKKHDSVCARMLKHSGDSIA